MRTNAVIIFAVLLTTFPVSAQQQQRYTQKLYCNLTWSIFSWEIVEPGGLFKKEVKEWVWNVKQTVATGSFWVADVNGQKVIVTAAHNIGLGLEPTQIDDISLDDDNSLDSLTIAPALGLLAFEIAEIGFPEPRADWIAIRPRQQTALMASKAIPLGDMLPQLGDQVRILGYPDTPHELEEMTTIAAIGANGDRLVLNKALEHGYSGGVVLNQKREAIGLVVTTEKKQSAALFISSAAFSKLNWKPFSAVKERKFGAASRSPNSK